MSWLLSLNNFSPLQYFNNIGEQMDESNFSDDLPHRQASSASFRRAKGASAKRLDAKKRGKKEGGNGSRANQWHEVKKSTSYYWTDLQNKKYVLFLKDSGNLLLLPPNERKIKKVNLIMSRRIKTRSATQCHTHHQKMMGKHGSIEQIISYYEMLPKEKRSEEPEEQNSEIQSNKNVEKQVMQSQLIQSEVAAPGSDVIMEPTFMCLAFNLGEQRFQYGFEFSERELLEWIDW